VNRVRGRKEGLKPLPHAAPRGVIGRLRFATRLGLDLQVRTVHRDMRRFLPGLQGNVLDLGCGQSPYRYLLGPRARYIGLDFEGSRDFGYRDEPDVTYFDGSTIPLDDGSIDHVLCTEVLEHVQEPEVLLQEVYRVLRAGGTGVFTIPWSARYHYIPHDYHRFTPSMLRILFSTFSRVEVEPRGTDVAAIASKVVVLAFRPLLGGDRGLISVLRSAVLAPVAVVAAIIGQLSIALNIGSPDDPLGYTVWVAK
jgi:SAM-dependent methyltransferase